MCAREQRDLEAASGPVDLDAVLMTDHGDHNVRRAEEGVSSRGGRSCVSFKKNADQHTAQWPKKGPLNVQWAQSATPRATTLPETPIASRIATQVRSRLQRTLRYRPARRWLPFVPSWRTTGVVFAHRLLLDDPRASEEGGETGAARPSARRGARARVGIISLVDQPTRQAPQDLPPGQARLITGLSMFAANSLILVQHREPNLSRVRQPPLQPLLKLRLGTLRRVAMSARGNPAWRMRRSRGRRRPSSE